MIQQGLLSEPAQPRNQEGGHGLAGSCSRQQLSAGHWLLGLHHSYLGPSGRNPSNLPPGAGRSHWQHQLPVLLSSWPPGELGCPLAGCKTSWRVMGHFGVQLACRPQTELSAVQASGSWDKNIHIWKPSTRSLLVQLKGHITWVKSIAFSPDGLQLASAGYSKMVTLPGPSFWQTPTPTSHFPLNRKVPKGGPGCQLLLYSAWHCASPNASNMSTTPTASGERLYCTQCFYQVLCQVC